MNKAQLVNEMIARSGTQSGAVVSHAEAAKLINALFDVLVETIASGETVQIRDFGAFTVEVSPKASTRSRSAGNPHAALINGLPKFAPSPAMVERVRELKAKHLAAKYRSRPQLTRLGIERDGADDSYIDYDNTCEFTEAEAAHAFTLRNEEEYSAFLDAVLAYRKRATALVFNAAREGRTTDDNYKIERLFLSVLRERGEVAAVTYVRLFYPLNQRFLEEVSWCFNPKQSTKRTRQSLYDTSPWQREVVSTQKLLRYPLWK